MSDPHLPLLLLVDDEPRILSALRRTLRREPFEVLTAEGPVEAMRAIESHALDLVMTDLKMPGMTGLELLQRVAELHPRAARLLITGGTEVIPEASLRAVGVRAVISKPWVDAELKETLRAASKDLSSAG